MEKELEDEIFFKYAFCLKCKKLIDNCECSIMQPIMELKQFQEARKELIEDEIKFLQSFQCSIDRKYLDIENRIKELENKTK